MNSQNINQAKNGYKIKELQPTFPNHRHLVNYPYTLDEYLKIMIILNQQSQYKLENSNMGNQPQSTSRFAEQHQWLTISKNKQKELIQNKLSREIVEIHRLPQIQPQHIRHDALVYQWRKDPRTITYIVQILEMSHSYQQEDRNCLSACQMPETHVDLLIYTQNILKLYQMNPKIQLDQGDQVGIFKDIIQGLDILSSKFGEFIPNKDSVGYNAHKRGKVWINDNFCLNNLQQKRTVKSVQDRARWQSQVIQTIVDICRLCSTQNNYKSHKFYYLLETIKNNRFNSFSAVREFQGPERKLVIQQKKEIAKISPEIIKQASKEVELNNSQKILSNPRQKKLSKDEQKVVNKTFDFPLITVHQPSQPRIMAFRSTYNHPNQQSIIFTHKEEKQIVANKINQRNKQKGMQHKFSYLKPNNHEVKKHKITNYVGQNFYSQKNLKNNLYNHRQQKQKPEHYALLQELYQSRSSRSQSKMIKKETIRLIDSMEMVQNRHEYQHSNGFHKMKNTVLEQSIIVKAAKR